MTTWEFYCALHLGALTVFGPKCHTTCCAEVAAARVHWPSGPILVCGGCAIGWGRVANALGYVVHIERVTYTPVGPRAPDDTEQRMRLLELV